jgi:cysteinyl-tRNA synthetase
LGIFFRVLRLGEAGGTPRGGRWGESPGGVPPASQPAVRLNEFREALADDFNTPRAMAEVFELVGEANRGDASGAPEAVLEMLQLVGLESLATVEECADAQAENLLSERESARAAKDFGRADAIRDELASLGWEVRDSADGAKLVRR